MSPVKVFFILAGYGVLPVAAFWKAYHFTDIYFRGRLIPHPFEITGIVVGIGFSCWTIALVYLAHKILFRQSKRSGK